MGWDLIQVWGTKRLNRIIINFQQFSKIWITEVSAPPESINKKRLYKSLRAITANTRSKQSPRRVNSKRTLVTLPRLVSETNLKRWYKLRRLIFQRLTEIIRIQAKFDNKTNNLCKPTFKLLICLKVLTKSLKSICELIQALIIILQISYNNTFQSLNKQPNHR